MELLHFSLRYVWAIIWGWGGLALGLLALNDLSEWLLGHSLKWLRHHRWVSAGILLIIAQAVTYHDLEEQLRQSRPTLAIMYGGSPLDGQVLKLPSNLFNIPSVQLLNTGTVETGLLSVRVYLSEKNMVSGSPDWQAISSDDPQLPTGFYWGGPRPVAPGEPWDTPILIAARANSESAFNSRVSVRMNVFYGAREPAVANFTVNP